jgi:hypothetical protein
MDCVHCAWCTTYVDRGLNASCKTRSYLLTSPKAVITSAMSESGNTRKKTHIHTKAKQRVTEKKEEMEDIRATDEERRGSEKRKGEGLVFDEVTVFGNNGANIEATEGGIIGL